jgi:uncharacterized delta-60 repeat protein
MWTSFLGLCLALSGSAPSRPARRRQPPFRRPASRPRLEALEDRCLLSAGTLDPTFGSGAGYVSTSPTNGADLAHTALIQPDGKILAAGKADVMNKQQTVVTADDFAVVRYNTNGSLDTSFGSGGIALASFGSQNSNPSVKNPSWIVSPSTAAVYPQAGTVNDGRIVMAGWIDKWWWSGQTSVDNFSFGLVRFNANGTLDSTFGNQGEVTTSLASLRGVGGVVIQPDGKIVVAGGTTTGFALARYNGNGTLDTSFGPGGEVDTPLGQWKSSANALLLQPDGKLILVGSTPTDSAGDADLWEIARYTPAGSLDASFGTGGIVGGTFGAGADAHGAALYPSGTADAGKIVVVGDTASGRGMARYLPDGSPDGAFGMDGEVVTTANNDLMSVAIAADGKLVVAGGNGSQTVARYNANGSVDSTFGTLGIVSTAIGTGNSYASAVILQSNGDIVTVGYATNSTKSLFTVARYLPSEPEIGSFTASPNPVTSGSSTTLTASNITDANPGATVTRVTFYYYDGNGNKVTLGTVTTGSGGVWTLNNYTVTLASGTYTLYAQAEDSYNALGDPIALTLIVQ